MVLDLETSLGGPLFGPDSKDPNNDYYTLITGEHPDRIEVIHDVQGFHREAPEVFRNYLRNNDVLVGHNLPFDLGYIWEQPDFQHFTARGGHVWCTATAEYLIRGMIHKFPSLAELQEKYLGEVTKDDVVKGWFKSGYGAKDILSSGNQDHIDVYTRYCREDGASTLRVFAQQYRLAQKMGMLPIIKLHQRTIIAVMMMQKTGIVIDRVRCEKTLQEFRLQSLKCLNDATATIEHLWDERIGKFNINSPKHKSAVLFGGDFTIKEREQDGFFKNGNPKYVNKPVHVHIDGFGLPTELTERSQKTDQYVTNDATIQKIYKQSTHEGAKEYCRLQKLAMKYNKMASTYLEPFLKYSINGRLYPEYNLTKTKTSRFSSERPNAQNVPSKGDMLAPIQGQLVAPEGWVCAELDFEMLEIYVVALLSKDRALINDLLAGIDFHCLRLSWIPRLSENKSYDEIVHLCKVAKEGDWPLRRSKAKGISYKKAYGGGAKSLAEAEDLEVEDVQALFDQEDLNYQGVKRFNDNVMDTVKTNKAISRQINYASREQLGHKYENGFELLPIKERQTGVTHYKSGEYRHYGTYISPWNKHYCFPEYGEIFKGTQRGRKFSPTETKNWHIQGTAHDVVSMAMCECFDYVNNHKEDVQMIMQIHDSLRFYVKKGKEQLTIKALSDIMSNTPRHFKKYLNFDMDLVIPVEAKAGPDFANTEVYKHD